MGIASAMGASVGCCWSPARCISFSRLTRALMIATLGQDLSEPFQLYAPPQKLGVPLPAGSAPVALGRSKPRGEVHRDGDWHRSVHVWLTDGESLLLQRRSAHKDTHPNLLDVSCAGHLSGLDASLETAVKELKEELGFEATEEQLAESFVCTLPTQACHCYPCSTASRWATPTLHRFALPMHMIHHAKPSHAWSCRARAQRSTDRFKIMNFRCFCGPQRAGAP